MKVCDCCLEELDEYNMPIITEATVYCSLCGKDLCDKHTRYYNGSKYCSECMIENGLEEEQDPQEQLMNIELEKQKEEEATLAQNHIDEQDRET